MVFPGNDKNRLIDVSNCISLEYEKSVLPTPPSAKIVSPTKKRFSFSAKRHIPPGYVPEYE